MGPENHDHWRALWKIINQLIADANLHSTSSPRQQRRLRERDRAATGAHEWVKIEVPAQSLRNVALSIQVVVRLSTSITQIAQTVDLRTFEGQARSRLRDKT